MSKEIQARVNRLVEKLGGDKFIVAETVGTTEEKVTAWMENAGIEPGARQLKRIEAAEYCVEQLLERNYGISGAHTWLKHYVLANRLTPMQSIAKDHYEAARVAAEKA